MRILITALAPSHLLCMVPLAWAARTAGHDVLVAGRTPVARAAAAAGLPAVEVDEVPVAQLRERGSRIFPGHGWRHPLEIRVDQVLDGYLASATRFRPDLLLCDPIEFSGLITAGLLDVPAVVQRWGSPDAFTAGALERADAALGELCAGLGLDGGTVPRPVLTLDPCPPSLRPQPADPALPMRFVPYNGPQPVPGWAVAPARRPRVCVSFGLFGSQAAVHGADFVEAGELTDRIAALTEALRRRPDLDVLLAVPGALRDALGEPPSWFQAVDRMPLDQLFADCALAVHHGGAGTAMTACARGVPQLVLPPDHPSLASCAEGLVRGGGAVRLDAAAQTDPDAVGQALALLLDDPGPRARAGRLAEEIAAQPAPSALVSRLAAVL